MSVSWNEVRDRAIRFTRGWSTVTSERSEGKTFWDEFFEVFGLLRRTVASFEEPVRNLKGQYGYIDLFWRGVLLVEHKSFGQDLGKAESQAFHYIQDLARDGRTDEIPRYVILSDFARIVLHDLEPEEQKDLPLFDQWRVRTVEFPLAELHHHVREFAFLKGEKPVRLDPEDPANAKASAIMGDLHDTLKAGGYSDHPLERFLVRILFCLFADDTGIFDQPHLFQNYIRHRTREDGSDLGLHLAQLFEILDTPPERRQRNLDEDLAAFPYVNGGLFEERLPFAVFNREMRNALLACGQFNWSRISPAVFGSLFQSIMGAKERRQSGGHYTNERDIMKVIRSLFLDELREEFDQIKANRTNRRDGLLQAFHKKLGKLRFLDPACGCGNFLVITYRELRLLELDVLKVLHGGGQRVTDIQQLSRVDVDQMYGIEISEWPVRIAEVALWLLDHQMNQRVSEAFGQYYVRLPLRATPRIVCGNALRMDWKEVVAPTKCSYILGNPPFVGKHYQNVDQKADLRHVLGTFKNVGDLDYVVGWYYKAAEYVQHTETDVGFVATNSITQGEQVPLVWGLLFSRFQIKILFAHRTFAWESEARGKAHVHVVIIGFGSRDRMAKRLYDYDADPTEPVVVRVRNISPYLTPGSDLFVTKRQRPLCDVPEMRCGNKPSDGGHLILTDTEREELLEVEPAAAKFLRRFTGSEEFINGTMRWCLWLQDISPSELRALPRIMERVRQVREFREKSSAEPTRKTAQTPSLFFYLSQPSTRYIAVPEVSSERRNYIPMGFVSPDIIASNKIYVIASPSLFLFGVLSSSMHMAWVRQVAGRLESRFQYSGSMVYNNFPWPQDVTEKQKAVVEKAAQAVLDGRQEFPNATLADLYDPLTMPPKLAKAHTQLDRVVDRCYRPEPFTGDRQRVEHLFALYEHLAAPLVATTRPKRRRNALKEV